MPTFLASFLVFLGAAAALALGTLRRRAGQHGCGGCSARADDHCPGPTRTNQEAD